jgi:hypothetical protein
MGLILAFLVACKQRSEAEGIHLKASPDKGVNQIGLVQFDATGALKDQKLILSLDFLSDSYGMGHLPECLDPVESKDMVIGRIECTSGAQVKWDLKIGHLFQECYTDPDRSKVNPSISFNTPSCTQGVVKIFLLSPEIRVDIEKLTK